ncbi:MAG: hypothetical protein LC104_07970 [Bacteroidales bacterium]|nr:hypothetical protein [Bacteroidales bacterium]
MSIRVHEIQLQSEQHFGGKLPPQFLGYFLAELPIVVQQTISMALRNRSSLKGRRPQWLERAGDIRFTDHGGNGTSVLYFEAPTLDEGARELYQQGELWPSRPDGEDTGFDLLGDVLSDVAANNADSDHFDPTLLKRLMRFRRVFSGPFREIDITSRRYDANHSSRFTPATLQTVQTFLGYTPAAKRVRIVGTLDMIRVSTQTFGVRLDTGEEVRGIMPDGSIDEVKSLLNQRVLILGQAVYRASGRLLRIDADSVTSGAGEPSLWSRVPKASTTMIDTSKLHKPQGPRSGMAAIIGKWPGDETDEQIQEALEKLS